MTRTEVVPYRLRCVEKLRMGAQEQFGKNPRERNLVKTQAPVFLQMRGEGVM
jgi:hypothetical protein